MTLKVSIQKLFLCTFLGGSHIHFPFGHKFIHAKQRHKKKFFWSITVRCQQVKLSIFLRVCYVTVVIFAAKNGPFFTMFLGQCGSLRGWYVGVLWPPWTFVPQNHQGAIWTHQRFGSILVWKHRTWVNIEDSEPIISRVMLCYFAWFRFTVSFFRWIWLIIVGFSF